MTISTHQEKILFLIPSKVHRGLCQKSELVSPLQYYSEPGESIYVLDYSTHKAISKFFLHFDANGVLLARLWIGDQPLSERLELALGIDELQQMSFIESNFNDCLLEMHLFSGQSSSPHYDESELEELRARSNEAPVVIGGCGRSGTTLLLSILGAHPAILAFPEELYAFYPKPFRIRKLLNAMQDFGTTRAWRRWCEKTPKNIRVFDDITALFEGRVKTIHIVRDGRDVVTSHHPNDESRYYITPERWVSDVTAGLNSKDAYLVRYEDLVQTAKVTLEGICDYIGEEFDPNLLRHEETSSIKTNKAWKNHIVEPLHTDGINRWKLEENSERVEELMKYPGAIEILQELHYL